MALEPNLPHLRADSTVELPTEAGVWSAQGLSLDRLADSLKLPVHAVSALDLKSIPDVWAQPLVFVSALRRPSHPMHGEALRDWRALLALLGLANAYAARYQLDLRPVSLASGGGPGEPLRAVLRKLPPRVQLRQAVDREAPADWSEPVLLMARTVEGSGDRPSYGAWQVAGLLNPASLAASAKTSPRLQLPGAPWLRRGLSDPTRLEPQDRLPRSEYAILSRYLDDLQGELTGLAGEHAGDPLLNDLLGPLREYAVECRRLAQGYDPDRIEAPEPAGGPVLKPLYRRLRRAPRIRPEAYGPEFSETVVPFRSDIGESPFKGLLLLDPEVADTLGRSRQDVHVWREDTLASLAAPGQQLKVEQAAAAAGYWVVRPEAFFTREFVRLGDGGTAPGHDPRSGFNTSVLPLSPLALLVFDPQTLQERLKLEPRGDGVYEVRLELPIRGATRPHVIRREFRPAGAGAPYVAEERGLWQEYGMAAWPDLQHPEWRWNFLRFAFNPNTRAVCPRFGLSGAALNRLLLAEEPALRADRARAWLNGDACEAERTGLFTTRVTPPAQAGAEPPPLQRLRYLQEANTVFELQLSRFPFEAVAVSRSPDRGAEARPVGLVLLEPGRRPAIKGAEPLVAVDFGTTNTVACVQGSTRPIRFKSRVRPALTNPKLGEQERALQKWGLLEFFPPHESETPLPTVAKRRVLTPGAEPLLAAVSNGDDERPLFSDLIYFQPPGNPEVGQTPLDIERFSQEKDNLVFDLKWGRAGDARAREGEGPARVQAVARRFIRQFMMMTAAELLDEGVDPRRLSWRFSYPEAMRDRSVDFFRRSINQSWSELFDPAGGAEPAVKGLVTEGAAAAKYFVGRQFPGRLLIIFDIGGGTTDVAVLKDQALVWRGSFRLAGGDFVTHYVMNNPGLFEGLKLSDFAQLRRHFSDQTSSLYGDRQQGGQLKSFGELLFSDPRFSRAMRDNFRGIEEEESGEGLRHSAWVFLGGMAFYMGLVVRTLVDRGDVSLGDLKHIGFGLGGRGSTFYRLYGGRGPGSPLHQLLGCFNQGGGFTAEEASERTELMSEEAKLEVVLGMLGDHPRDEADLERLSRRTSADTPIGEILMREGGQPIAALTVPMAKLEGLEGLGYPDLQGLQGFLAALKRQVRLAVDLRPGAPDGAHQFIQAQVFRGVQATVEEHRAAMAELEGLDEGPTVEPAFITGLRALLDRLGLPPEERRAALQVREL